MIFSKMAATKPYTRPFPLKMGQKLFILALYPAVYMPQKISRQKKGASQPGSAPFALT
jgi:hypothetical protein